jgi:putative nucleotidyltransferase with HDIG domain
MPHLASNGYINDDLCRTVRLMLRTAYAEEESLEYIQEVILNRNSMTLIHSMMVGKIASIIMNALIDKTPDMFFELLGTRDVHLVRNRRQYLVNYIDRCAHLHDIGKAYISDIINQQTRKLTDEEFFLIKQHPTFGAELLAGTKLAEKYNSVIEGHHKSFDGKSGYPEYFSSVGDRMKVMVDIITIADCIDAATDTLGRNYTKSKTWLPALADELENDEKMRYNQEIVNIIKNDQETCDSISYITDEGRTDIYYDIYRKYISDTEEDNAIQIEQVMIK